MIYNKKEIDMSLVECPYEEEDGYIYITDDYTNNILKLSDYSGINDEDYAYLCRCNILVGFLYEYALHTAGNAYVYAQYVIDGKFSDGENIISKSPKYSYWYSRYILNGRFELGEPAIATNAHYSYWYAREILRERFELGEPAIASSDEYSYSYCRDIIKSEYSL